MKPGQSTKCFHKKNFLLIRKFFLFVYTNQDIIRIFVYTKQITMQNTANNLENNELNILRASDLKYIIQRLEILQKGIIPLNLSQHGEGIYRLIRFEYREPHGFKFFTKQFDYLSINSTPIDIEFVCYISVKELSNVLVPREENNQNELFPVNTF